MARKRSTMIRKWTIMVRKYQNMSGKGQEIVHNGQEVVLFWPEKRFLTRKLFLHKAYPAQTFSNRAYSVKCVSSELLRACFCVIFFSFCSNISIWPGIQIVPYGLRCYTPIFDGLVVRLMLLKPNQHLSDQFMSNLCPSFDWNIFLFLKHKASKYIFSLLNKANWLDILSCGSFHFLDFVKRYFDIGDIY